MSINADVPVGESSKPQIPDCNYQLDPGCAHPQYLPYPLSIKSLFGEMNDVVSMLSNWHPVALNEDSGHYFSFNPNLSKSSTTMYRIHAEFIKHRLSSLWPKGDRSVPIQGAAWTPSPAASDDVSDAVLQSNCNVQIIHLCLGARTRDTPTLHTWRGVPLRGQSGADADAPISGFVLQYILIFSERRLGSCMASSWKGQWAALSLSQLIT